MEKRTVHSFNGLAIFVFFLYFTNVSSDPIQTTKIIDFMKNDEKLCRAPDFLYTSSIVSTCANESYPVEPVAVDYSSRNMFLCLVLYDAWYKVCQSQQLKESFNTTFTNGRNFDAYLQQLAPKEEDKDGSIFCKSVEGVTFAYEKIKPKLSVLQNFNSSAKCSRFCFNMDDRFFPLCEILAWSKSIDNEAKKLATETPTGLESVMLQKNQSRQVNDSRSSTGQKVIGSPQITASSTHEGNKPNDEVKEITNPKEKAKPPSSEKKQVQVTDTRVNPMDVREHEDDQPVGREEPNNKPADTESENSKKKQDSPDVEIAQSGDKSQTAKKESQNTEKETQTVDSPSINKELPITNKVSDELENTEINPTEWSNSGNGKFLDDPSDPVEIDPPIDPDQPQSMHKSTEEKVSSFHTMRADDESHFFTYFTVLSMICIIAYTGYYNKHKLLAIVLEGRRSRNSRDRRPRPPTANYRKLDCTLEEAVTSQCNANVTHVIY